MSKSYLISWLDSCNQPSARHLTCDQITTICGHDFSSMFNKGIWKPHRSPRKSQGRSNFCKVCFSQGLKSSEWLI